MLHPGGDVDFQYLTIVLQQKEITSFDGVPSFLHNFCMYVAASARPDIVKYLRSVMSGGM